MKHATAEDNAQDAREILSRIHAERGQDFHTLRSEQVESLLAFADQRKYRKPKNANGSRGRYFYQMLQRRAK